MYSSYPERDVISISSSISDRQEGDRVTSESDAERASLYGVGMLGHKGLVSALAAILLEGSAPAQACACQILCSVASCGVPLLSRALNLCPDLLANLVQLLRKCARELDTQGNRVADKYARTIPTGSHELDSLLRDIDTEKIQLGVEEATCAALYSLARQAPTLALRIHSEAGCMNALERFATAPLHDANLDKKRSHVSLDAKLAAAKAINIMEQDRHTLKISRVLPGCTQDSTPESRHDSITKEEAMDSNMQGEAHARLQPFNTIKYKFAVATRK